MLLGGFAGYLRQERGLTVSTTTAYVGGGVLSPGTATTQT